MPSNSTNHSIYREATRAVLLGLAVNLILGVVKLMGGILGNSFALIADAVNSLGDAITSLFVLFALRIAQYPPDKEHPYGHTKAEAIAGSNVALLIILSALLVGWEAIGRIHVMHMIPPVWTLWIAGVNVVIKECLYHYKLRIGKRTGSSALIANAWDHRSDALCSLSVLVGLGVVRWGGPAWIGADEAAALMVVVLIVWSGILLFRNSCSELMDVQARPELVQEIRQVAGTVAGVKEIEKLRVRKSGLEYFVDIHIGVDQHLTVAEGHRIGHQVKDKLIVQFPALRDVLVHLEPFPHMHEKVN
ncbi:MAG: cation diffusion facilitator family transporter [Pirellulales bacterium]